MSEWQKIETAPRDGTRVLLYQPDGMYRSRGRHRGASIEVGYWHIAANVEHSMWVAGGSFRPTHWMPLPEPPK